MDKKKLSFPATILVALIFAAGCGGGSNPITPPGTTSHTAESGQANRIMWGLWTCTMAPGEDEITIVPLRTASFTLNINSMLAGSPGSFGIGDLDMTDFLTEGRIDCTVTVTHPLSDLDKFHGFDVWGVFLHNGDSQINYDLLTYPGGPDAGANEGVLLNTDGYTRWFNQPEFDGDVNPIFEYTPGVPSNLPTPSAQLNGYIIFANGLSAEMDYYSAITSAFYANNRNIFRAGTSCSRRYELDFPLIGGSPKLDFQFAIIASWASGDPSITGDPDVYEPFDFPPAANVDEAFFVHTDNSESTLYFNDYMGAGGSFIADIEVFDWQGGIVGGQGVLNEINGLYIEGDFLPGGMAGFTQPELSSVAIDGTGSSSVFQIEITDCAPVSSGVSEFWVIVESSGVDGDSYDQGAGTSYPAGARRASFLRDSVNVYIHNPINMPPSIASIFDDVIGPPGYMNPVTTDYTSVTYNVIFDDPDIYQDHTVLWWIYESGQDPTPFDLVEMPVNWHDYVPGDFIIEVSVDDGQDSDTATFAITLEDGVIPEWGDPQVIEGPVNLHCATVDWNGDIVLSYNKEGTGIMYAINDGSWGDPETAYAIDPDFLHIVPADSADPDGALAYVGYVGDGAEVGNGHALRWSGDPGVWDYRKCIDTNDLVLVFMPDDDGSFRGRNFNNGNIYAFESDSWGSGTTPDPLPSSADKECIVSYTNFVVRDGNFHYLAYMGRHFFTNAGMIRIHRQGKGESELVEYFTIDTEGGYGAFDAPSLCMDNSGNLHAAWKIAMDDFSARIDYSKSEDNGETWSVPVTVFTEQYGSNLLDGFVGITVDSLSRVYITYARNPYIYMVMSDDGTSWSDPSSPYEEQLPLGYHWSQPYPVVTPDNALHVFYLSKNEIFPEGALCVVTWQ